MITHDLSLILASVYGKRGIPFPGSIIEAGASPIAESFKNNVTQERNERSLYDKELYRQNSMGRMEFLPATLEGVKLPNSLVSIQSKKNIIETPLVGRDGAVLEIINNDKYQIKIICTEIRPENIWPEEILHTLRDLYLENRALTLQCALTDPFLQPLDNVVIKSINVPPMQGIENAQIIELTLISDIYFELE